jgi:membrane associated rhomboid family serine protease
MERDAGSSALTSVAAASATVQTLAVMVAVTVVRWAAGPLGTALFVLSPPVVLRPWTLVTSVYAHGGLWHLASNAVALLIVGSILERRTTRLRFHAFFLAVGAASGVVQVAVGSLLAVGLVGVLGASGAIFGCLGYLLAGNRLAGGLLARLPLSPRATAVAAVLAAGLLALLGSPPGSALIAHFVGLLLGLVAGRLRLLDVRQSVTSRR